MAYAPLSPSITAGPSHSHHTHTMAPGLGTRSATPPVNPHQHAPSKRDKRRNALQEKCQDLADSFTNTRDYQFRQMVHELQNEMALIAYAEVSNDDVAPQSDAPEDIAARIQALATGNQIVGDSLPTGRWFASFIQEVNKTKEERDAGLVELKNRHRNSLNRIQEERDFRRQLAVEEHKKLAETIRERLVQSITHRKSRLMKDKEHLDIADTSALLLHPNQFSITNPASPGGIHGNRKTRGTRRGADFDDFGSGLGAEPLNKRKRKAMDDGDYGSPARDGGGLSTPGDRNRARLSQQQNAPAYNILSLFTEKELAMHSNQAHVAAVHFLAAAKRARQTATGPASGTNTDRDDASGDADGGDNNNNNSGQEDNAGGATDMERTASQQNFHHATRSTRTNGGSGSLNLLGELAEKTATRPNLPYFILGNYHARPNGAMSAPTPPGLMHEEIEEDLARFAALRNKPKGWVDRRLLDSLVADMQDRSSDEPAPSVSRQRWSTLHPDFPPQMDVHLVRANPRKQQPQPQQ